MYSFVPDVTLVWKLAHTIHLCVLWGLVSQLLPNAPWSQYQFATTASTWLAIGNLISKVFPVWEGWVQSWNDCWVKKRTAPKKDKSVFRWYFFRKDYWWSIVTHYWGASLRKYCLNVSYDCLCRVNSRKDVSAERNTALCAWGCAVWFVSWDCSEFGGLMNLPKEV